MEDANFFAMVSWPKSLKSRGVEKLLPETLKSKHHETTLGNPIVLKHRAWVRSPRFTDVVKDTSYQFAMWGWVIEPLPFVHTYCLDPSLAIDATLEKTIVHRRCAEAQLIQANRILAKFMS